MPPRPPPGLPRGAARGGPLPPPPGLARPAARGATRAPPRPARGAARGATTAPTTLPARGAARGPPPAPQGAARGATKAPATPPARGAARGPPPAPRGAARGVTVSGQVFDGDPDLDVAILVDATGTGQPDECLIGACVPRCEWELPEQQREEPSWDYFERVAVSAVSARHQATATGGWFGFGSRGGT